MPEKRIKDFTVVIYPSMLKPRILNESKNSVEELTRLPMTQAWQENKWNHEDVF